MAGNELVVDVPKIKKAAHSAIPLTITTYTLPHEIEVYIEEVLEVFLGELGQAKLKDYLVYCLRELAVNAKKANTKRVYFETKGLDLKTPAEYEEGMSSFKQTRWRTSRSICRSRRKSNTTSRSSSRPGARTSCSRSATTSR